MSHSKHKNHIKCLKPQIKLIVKIPVLLQTAQSEESKRIKHM